jgi:hypothetical protein
MRAVTLAEVATACNQIGRILTWYRENDMFRLFSLVKMRMKLPQCRRSLRPPLDDLPNLAGQILRRERLGQKFDIRIEPSVMEDGVAGVAGGKQDRRIHTTKKAPAFAGADETFLL